MVVDPGLRKVWCPGGQPDGGCGCGRSACPSCGMRQCCLPARCRREAAAGLEPFYHGVGQRRRWWWSGRAFFERRSRQQHDPPLMLQQRCSLSLMNPHKNHGGGGSSTEEQHRRQGAADLSLMSTPYLPCAVGFSSR